MGTAECQRGTCSCVNVIEGTGKVCGLSWPQEGPPGSGTGQNKGGCCRRHSSAAEFKAGTVISGSSYRNCHSPLEWGKQHLCPLKIVVLFHGTGMIPPFPKPQ